LAFVGSKQAERQEVERLISVDGAAELLDCSASLVRRMVKAREIPFVMIGNRPKFLPSALYAWVVAQSQQSVAQQPESAA
jgi:excisionase family DNA binding protein